MGAGGEDGVRQVTEGLSEKVTLGQTPLGREKRKRPLEVLGEERTLGRKSSRAQSAGLHLDTGSTRVSGVRGSGGTGICQIMLGGSIWMFLM